MVNTIARPASASYFICAQIPRSVHHPKHPQTTSDLKHLSIEFVTNVLLANSSKPPVLHHGATRFPLSKHRRPSQGHPKQSQHRWWWGTQTHYKWRKSAWSKHGHDSNQDWKQRHDKKSVRMLVWQSSCLWGWSSFGCSPVSWHFQGRLRTHHPHTSNRLKAWFWEMNFFGSNSTYLSYLTLNL